MVDVVDAKTRSRMMAGIQGKDTRPELTLRRMLHARGYRYRLHVKGLPGRPDIVMRKRRIVIFVHGCFWHRHAGCRFATIPRTRAEFWREKFETNLARDRKVRSALLDSGWRVAIVWECALRSLADAVIAADMLVSWLDGSSSEFELGKSGLLEEAGPEHSNHIEMRPCQDKKAAGAARSV